MVNDTGLGDLRLGMTVREMEKTLGLKLSSWNESEYDSSECWYTELLSSPNPQVGYMMEKDRLVRINIYDFEGAPTEAEHSNEIQDERRAFGG